LAITAVPLIDMDVALAAHAGHVCCRGETVPALADAQGLADAVVAEAGWARRTEVRPGPSGAHRKHGDCGGGSGLEMANVAALSLTSRTTRSATMGAATTEPAPKDRPASARRPGD
jgi:hypothetical protein